MGDLLHFPAHRSIGVAPPVTKAELSQRLRVSKRWINYRMNEGMPVMKDELSRLVRFDVAAVEQWLTTRRTG